MLAKYFFSTRTNDVPISVVPPCRVFLLSGRICKKPHSN